MAFKVAFKKVLGGAYFFAQKYQRFLYAFYYIFLLTLYTN